MKNLKTSLVAILIMVGVMAASAATINVANIAALRTATSSLALNATTTDTYVITGEVFVNFVSTSTSSVRTFYIQDATGALMVYDSGKLTNAFTYNVNDGITGFTGTVKNYNGMWEMIVTAATSAASSTGHAAFPIVTTTLDNLINYPGQICKVLNVQISDLATGGTGQFVVSKNYPLAVGGVTSTTVLRTSYGDVNYIGTALPSTKQDITGLVLIYQTTTTPAIVDLIPRSSSDMVASSSTDVAEISTPSLQVSVSNGSVLVNAQDGETIVLFNSLGNVIARKTAAEGLNTIAVDAKGLVIVKVGNQSTKVIL
jgi:hypothetical protein